MAFGGRYSPAMVRIREFMKISDYDGGIVEGSTQAAEFVYLGENASGIDG